MHTSLRIRIRVHTHKHIHTNCHIIQSVWLKWYGAIQPKWSKEGRHTNIFMIVLRVNIHYIWVIWRWLPFLPLEQINWILNLSYLCSCLFLLSSHWSILLHLLFPFELNGNNKSNEMHPSNNQTSASLTTKNDDMNSIRSKRKIIDFIIF